MKVRNTMSKMLEEFESLVPGKVGMYVCGPTVYSYFHIGNARPFIVFDVIRRYLLFKGYEVTFVQNITDVDDKLIKQSLAENKPVSEIAKIYTDAYFEDLSTLGVLPATHNPKASESIEWIIKLIKRLEDNGFTYIVEHPSAGGVYFRIEKFEEYTKLSHKDFSKMMLGASGRIDESLTDKLENPFDFAVWKFKKEEHEPAWESPWGEGRPGWHIECSAMSMKLLGDSFDIHGGGEDLIFPHHENEIAQAEAATGKPFVKYWLHNGYIKMGEEKMSKSVGNVRQVREILADGYTGQDLRFFMLQAHYRGPITFTQEILDEAKTGRRRVLNAYKTLGEAYAKSDEAEGVDDALIQDVLRLREQFLADMDDDFNTVGALGRMFELVTLSNKYIADADVISRALLVEIKKAFDDFAQIFGLVLTEEVLRVLTEEEQKLLDARAKARVDKNWAESDRLRDELKNLGIIVKDSKDGQTHTFDRP
ncbi:MAG: cysteine--tRNA ligase [Planctomycetes bacterium]|nr:cysteine--tRNA ligase [Planctomycetota bacterium]